MARYSKPKKDVGMRLREIRLHLDMNQTQLAEALGGCSQGFVSDVEVGRSAPSAAVVAGVEKLGFSSAWLMTGEGVMVHTGDRVMERATLQNQKEIPLVGKVAAGLGQFIPDDEIERTIYVPLGDHACCDCFASKVVGHSMEPVFRPGDIIVIDKSCPPVDNDIAVVTLDDQVMLKRVSMDDDNVYLLSINTNMPPIRVSRNHDGARVVGKVIQLLRDKF